MPRKKNGKANGGAALGTFGKVKGKPEPEVLQDLPQTIRETLHDLQSRKVTARTLSKYQQRVHCLLAPVIIPRLYMAIIELLGGRDKEVLKLACQVFNLTPMPNSGVSVTTNILNQNAQAALPESGSSWSFDQVVRQLAEGRKENEPKLLNVTPG